LTAGANRRKRAVHFDNRKGCSVGSIAMRAYRAFCRFITRNAAIVLKTL